MQLRECEYFITIAQEGNMGRAARLLYVSQPTLSKMLNKLEKEIGTPLFERSSAGMVPTQAGEIYLETAQRLVELNAEMEQRFRLLTSQQPTLDIGISFMRREVLTKYIIPRLAQKFSGMQVHDKINHQNRLVTDLLSNLYNVCVGFVPCKLPPSVACEIVGEERFVLAVPKNSPLIQKARRREGCEYPHLAAGHLKDIPLIVARPDSYSTRVARAFFERHQMSPSIALCLQQPYGIIDAVAANVGVALLPSVPLETMGLQDKITYLDVNVSTEPMAVGVMYRKGHVLTPIEQFLIATLRDAYGSNPIDAGNHHAEEKAFS